MINSIDSSKYTNNKFFSIQRHCQSILIQHKNPQHQATLCFIAASLPALQNKISTFLHQEEIGYWNTLHYEKRQHSFLLGRYAAKQALVYQSPELSPLDIQIKKGAFEQPVLYLPTPQKIQITLSHSESLGVALAFPEEYPMGVDLECIKTTNNKSIESQLTMFEKNWIASVSNVMPEVLYTVLWTIKEALSKTLRTGITTPLEIFAIKNLIFQNHYWLSEFVYFTQYKAISFQVNQYIVSIVYPKESNVIVDVASVQNWALHL